jgi:hypothetical protein
MIKFSSNPQEAEKQMHAIIFYLTAFGYIDADFDQAEKGFIRDFITNLVDSRAREAMGDASDEVRGDVVKRWSKHFHEVLDEIDHGIASHFTESVAEGENSQQFVLAKLKLRCYELFKQFDEDNRHLLLETVDELMQADGVIHPAEEKFRAELEELIQSPMELDDSEIEMVEEGAMVIDSARKMAPRSKNHPFFQRYEWDYADDPEQFKKQTAGDMELIDNVMKKLEEQRLAGKGRLMDSQDVSEFDGQDPFLDGHVYMMPPKPNKEYELLVLGDLHGCYSCLKAALLQADFFEKVQAYHDDPEKNPAMKLVLLGDYIDRGRYSYNGILRTVMQLFLTVPDHVYMLRGNHEYYVELNGRVYGGVRPAEAINSLSDRARPDIFRKYMNLFEALPNMLIFNRTLFVHAGIPREDTIAQKWSGLASLNNSDIRFQMLWSDPSEADYIPLELQKSNARFPFGRKQFKSFMARLGCHTLIRGHERIKEGFRTIYDDPEARLLNLFSAGGAENKDLPPESNYREVEPMALQIKFKDGISQIMPFAIDWASFNDPEVNAFFKAQVS